jgi:hypothetical protein
MKCVISLHLKLSRGFEPVIFGSWRECDDSVSLSQAVRIFLNSYLFIVMCITLTILTSLTPFRSKKWGDSFLREFAP